MNALRPVFLASLIVVAGAIVLGIVVTNRAAASRATPAEATAALDPVERGHYLVKVIGCSDCHTPKIMTDEGPVLDESRLLSGHPDGGALPKPPDSSGPWIATGSWDLTAWSGPWGISYTANLTPDTNTGIGIWTEDMFVRAIRTGRHMGQSRPILPPMPWQFYRDLTDEDLAAIYAYLRTIPPVHNRVPEPVPPGGVEVALFE
jgi:mono/diheme cytochrome c family protein